MFLSSVFNGIVIATEDGHFGIAQRDTGIEIKTPDGSLVGVKVDRTGRVAVEIDGKWTANLGRRT